MDETRQPASGSSVKTLLMVETRFLDFWSKRCKWVAAVCWLKHGWLAKMVFLFFGQNVASKWPALVGQNIADQSNWSKQC